MFYQQPPVGNPVVSNESRNFVKQPDQVFAPFHANFYASGTASLAAALIAAKRAKPVDHPEVILPAYACPDLLSAAVFAGVKPVLVDLEDDRPWLDLNDLGQKLSEQTIGIVAVDLFGIAERHGTLGEMAKSVGAILIEDSAQSFPAGSGASDFWQGDLVVVSFGRGKPVSLLGGGVVLSRAQPLSDLLPGPERVVPNTWAEAVKYRLKAALYNFMISPRLYWIPQSLAFLHLGETRYHPLLWLEGMDSTRQSLLPANLSEYRSLDPGLPKRYSRLISELEVDPALLVDLPRITDTPFERRLLRYPLLVAPEIRDKLFLKLRRAGLGPSLMYPSILPEIPGVERLVENQGDFPGASSFARRILTMPTHGRIRSEDVSAIQEILVECIQV